jgi:NADPH:quinone reductase-like Zn-dependent oxidoreductase
MSTPSHRSQVWPGLGQDFVLQSIETHQVPSDHILIKVSAVAINPGDFKIQGAYSNVIKLPFPSNLGQDGVGIVAEVGKNITHVAVGDRV